MRILLVEDDESIASVIQSYFKKTHIIDILDSAESCLKHLELDIYDLFIFDVNLPNRSGISLCHSLRNDEIFTPILLLSADTQIITKVSGLNAGSDDYLTKPFSFSELEARIHALTRRNSNNYQDSLKIGLLTITPISRSAQYKNIDIPLRSKEFNLLEFFARNKNIVLSKQLIIEHIWQDYENHSSNTFEVHLNRLRNKLKLATGNKMITTIRGYGYVLKDK